MVHGGNMKEYHKIQSIFKRDDNKNLLEGQWTLPEFEYLQNNQWVFTEKVDGTNIRVMFNEGKITFGGKTNNAQIPAMLVTHLNEVFLPKSNIFNEVFVNKSGIFNDVCLYGEGYGAKIQKGGGNYRPDQGFVLFDIRIGTFWLQRVDVEDIAQKLGIDIVPIIGGGTLHDAITKVKKGFTSTWGNFLAEGIVARPKIELNTRGGRRIITKVKHRDF